jgi:ABC-type branched-subunit amino acid transport system substrate-binding protein
MKQLLCVLALSSLAASAAAQILIGQTAGFTGAVAAGVKETTDGAKMYFDAINARGGINGQSIELVSMDDKFDPKLAAENAKKLITEKNVVALFLVRGTPHTQAIAPLLAEYRVPLVAPSTVGVRRRRGRAAGVARPGPRAAHRAWRSRWWRPRRTC